MPHIRQEAGITNVTLTGGSGDGTQAVTFDHCFQKTPAVICGFAESLAATKRGFVAATSITNTGFTITVDSDSALTDIDVAWVAIERRSSDWAALTDT